MAANRLSLTPVQKLLLSEVLVVLILLFSLGVYGALYQNRPEAPQVEITVPELNVDVFQVEQAGFQELIYGFGTVQPDREVIVSAQVSGEVIEIGPQLDVGRRVLSPQLMAPPSGGGTIDQPGDLLVQIDPEDFLQRQRQASSRIEEAKTELQRLDVVLASTKKQLAQSQDVLKTLTAEFDRIQSAVKRRASSESELSRSLLEVQRYQESILQLQNQLDSMPAERRAAEQRLANSKAEAEQVTNELQRTKVMPPFDGVVSDVSVELGQYVRGGEPLFRLTDLSSVEIPVALPLDEFLRLQILQENGIKPLVRLRASDEAGVSWTGDLVRVSPEADSASRTVKVFIEVINSPDATPLLPGTFVTAAIDGPTTERCLLVPRESIVDGRLYVVDSDGKAAVRSVNVVKTVQSMAVVEGVAEGDQVIVTNLDLLTDGRQVNVQQKLTLESEVSGLRKSRIKLLPSQEK